MMWVSYVTGNALLNTGVTVAVRHYQYQAQPVPDNGVAYSNGYAAQRQL